MTRRVLSYAVKASSSCPLQPSCGALASADLHRLAGPCDAGYDRRKRDADHARAIVASPTTPC